MSTPHTEPTPQSPHFDLKTVVFITAVAAWATAATLILVGDIGTWSSHTQRALLVGGLVIALGGSTAFVITGQMWVAARRRVEEAAHEQDRQARSAEILERLDGLKTRGDDTLTNIGEIMARIQIVLDDSAARHQAIVDEMKQVAGNSLAAAQHATQEADEARWRLIVEELRREAGLVPMNGTKTVVPMRRPGDPSTG